LGTDANADGVSDGWTFSDGGVTTVEKSIDDGGQKFTVTNANVNNASVTIQKSITAVAGNVAQCTIKYKSSNIYTRLSMTASPSGTALITTTSRQSEGAYTEITLTGSAAPAGTTSIIIGIGARAINVGDTGSAWFKDATVTISNQSYDQSESGLHVTQTTAANQPRIVNAGVVEIDASGKPTLYFDGSDDTLINTSATTLSNLCSISCVVKNTDATASILFALFFGDETGDINRVNIRNTGSTALLEVGSRLPTNSLCQATRSITNQTIISYTRNTESAILNAQQLWSNGASLSHKDDATTTFSNGARLNIGSGRTLSTNTLFWNGTVSELIITNPLSDSQRQRLERNQSKFFGIPVS
jgi:hypothetical protein